MFVFRGNDDALNQGDENLIVDILNQDEQVNPKDVVQRSGHKSIKDKIEKFKGLLSNRDSTLLSEQGIYIIN